VPVVPVVPVVTVTVVTVPEVVVVGFPLVVDVAVVNVPEVVDVAVVNVPEVVDVAVVNVPEVVVVGFPVVLGCGEYVGELTEVVKVVTPEEEVVETDVVKDVGVYGKVVVTEIVVAEVGIPLVAPVVAPVVMFGITGLKEVTPVENEGVPVPPVGKYGNPGQSLVAPAPQTVSPCTMVPVPPPEPVDAAVRQSVTTLSVKALIPTVPGRIGDDGGIAEAGSCQENTCMLDGSKYWPFL